MARGELAMETSSRLTNFSCRRGVLIYHNLIDLEIFMNLVKV